MEHNVVVDFLTEHDGLFPFQQLVEALKATGLDESRSRELIWQTLALGLIEFTPDRSALRILPNEEGKVA